MGRHRPKRKRSTLQITPPSRGHHPTRAKATSKGGAQTAPKYVSHETSLAALGRQEHNPLKHPTTWLTLKTVTASQGIQPRHSNLRLKSPTTAINQSISQANRPPKRNNQKSHPISLLTNQANGSQSGQPPSFILSPQSLRLPSKKTT